MILSRVLRVSAFADQSNVCQVDITSIADADGRKTTHRFSFPDAQTLLDAAEKLHLVGTAMLRHSPRPVTK